MAKKAAPPPIPPIGLDDDDPNRKPLDEWLRFRLMALRGAYHSLTCLLLPIDERTVDRAIEGLPLNLPTRVWLRSKANVLPAIPPCPHCKKSYDEPQENR